MTITKWTIRNKKSGLFYKFVQLCDDGYGNYQSNACFEDMDMTFWDNPHEFYLIIPEFCGVDVAQFGSRDTTRRNKCLEWVRFDITMRLADQINIPGSKT